MQPQIILITGASSGFGKITAQMLSEQGHIVYGTSRKPSENIGKVRMLVVDVTNSISVRQAVEQIISEQGRMDVLINNAGMGIGGALELATEEEVSMQMNTNFFGVVNMCKAVLPYMRKARRGKIINISSIGGVMGIPYQGFYSSLQLKDIARPWRWKFIRFISKSACCSREILIPGLPTTGISLN